VLAEAAALLALAAPGDAAYSFAVSVARNGPRPAGSAAEARAHGMVARRFRAAGLTVRVQRFPTRRGRSRNVIGVIKSRPPRRDCLRVLMAHADSMPAGPGAEDNASGLGALVGLAPRLRAPECDVWLVATGAEERLYTGSPDHLGARALAPTVPRRRLRYALSLDEVGTSPRLRLRSPVAAPRRGVERELLRAAGPAGVRLDWLRDSGTGNSDHRELELSGRRAVKLGVLDNPCRHAACDTASRLRRGAFRATLRLLEGILY
jgi:aminopeptidase YwaD